MSSLPPWSATRPPQAEASRLERNLCGGPTRLAGRPEGCRSGGGGGNSGGATTTAWRTKEERALTWRPPMVYGPSGGGSGALPGENGSAVPLKTRPRVRDRRWSIWLEWETISSKRKPRTARPCPAAAGGLHPCGCLRHPPPMRERPRALGARAGRRP